MKVAILVPVYNCNSVINGVIEDILAHSKLSVFVIDDGSTPAVQLSTQSSQVHLLRLEQNAGKGMALRYGFKHCADLGFTHVLVMDGDGQHLGENISKFTDLCEKNPRALIVGCREFKEGVPGVSKFGRAFSNFWVWYQTSVKVKDSQSGMRLYPLEKLVGFKYFTGRYDFEIEVLVRAIWSGVPVEEIDISVFYPEESQRISHFDKFRDNVRISWLNTLLVTYSLLFRHNMSFVRALLLGVTGFLVAQVPSFGWSLFFGVFTCVVFRLNVISMLLVIILLRLF